MEYSINGRRVCNSSIHVGLAYPPPPSFALNGVKTLICLSVTTLFCGSPQQWQSVVSTKHIINRDIGERLVFDTKGSTKERLVFDTKGSTQIHK